jgi:hypothetical protein
MQNLVNTQIMNVIPIQLQIQMFTNWIDQKIGIVHKEVLQTFALSAKAEKMAKGVSERKGKEVQKAILAKDVEY